MKYFTIDAQNNITLHADRPAARDTGAAVFTSEVQFADLIGNDNQRLVEIWNAIPGVKAISKFANRKIATERIWKAIQTLGGPAPQEPEAVAEIAATEPVAQPQAEAIQESVAPPATDEPSIPAPGQQAAPEATATLAPSVAPAESAAETTTPFHEHVAPVSARTADVAPTDGEPSKEAIRAERALTSAPEVPVGLETTQVATAPEATTETIASAGAQPAGVAPVEAKATKKATRTKKAPTGATNASVPREGSKTSRVIAMLKREEGTTLEEIMTAMGWQEHTTRAMMSAGGSLTKKHGLVVTSEKVGDKRTYRINQ